MRNDVNNVKIMMLMMQTAFDVDVDGAVMLWYLLYLFFNDRTCIFVCVFI